MYLLVSGASKTVREWCGHPNLGQLKTPHCGTKIICDVWGADNAAYSNWDRVAWLKMLNEIDGTTPKFCTMPDVVCDARKTLYRARRTEKMVRKRGLPPSLVLQNGQEWIGVYWHLCDSIFIGGDDEFKLGKYAQYAIRSAKEKGYWVHMGRVNSLKRLKQAYDFGCDSVDGTGVSMYPDTYIPKFLDQLDFLSRQQRLF